MCHGRNVNLITTDTSYCHEYFHEISIIWFERQKAVCSTENMCWIFSKFWELGDVIHKTCWIMATSKTLQQWEMYWVTNNLNICITNICIIPVWPWRVTEGHSADRPFSNRYFLIEIPLYSNIPVRFCQDVRADQSNI